MQSRLKAIESVSIITCPDKILQTHAKLRLSRREKSQNKKIVDNNKVKENNKWLKVAKRKMHTSRSGSKENN